LGWGAEISHASSRKVRWNWAYHSRGGTTKKKNDQGGHGEEQQKAAAHSVLATKKKKGISLKGGEWRAASTVVREKGKKRPVGDNRQPHKGVFYAKLKNMV